MGTPIILATHISSIHTQPPSKLMGVLNQPLPNYGCPHSALPIMDVLIQPPKLWMSSFSLANYGCPHSAPFNQPF